MNRLILSALFSIVISWSTHGQWTRISEEFIGTEINNGLGRGVSISDDGTVMAYSSMYYSGELTEQGFVVAYKWDGAEWNQMGDTLFGNEHNWSRIGRKIDLSGDGRRMLLTYDAWSILDIPRCAVFEFDGTDWVQLGGTMINGSGFSDVAISGDGNTVVFGFADEIDKLGSEFAYFWAMEYIAGWWELKGDGDVYGPDGLKFARSLDVNWDGTYILVGAPALLPGDAADEKVYRFSVHEDFGWWVQSNFSSDELVDFGHDVAMSNDGNRMAVLGRDPITGAFGCQVLELDEEFAWSQVHQTLFTNSSLLNEHASVSLSGNGQVLAIGIPSYQADGMEAPANAGQTIIFREVMDQWIQWDSPITGEDLNGFSGRDIQLNGTGNRIAIGAPGEYDLQDFPGKFAVWQNGTFVKIDEKPIANDLFYPNPSSGVVRSKQTYKGKIDIWNSMGQLVASMNMPSSELDLSFLETGIYVLKCDECKQSQHLVIQR